jgi:hypothetical protein
MLKPIRMRPPLAFDPNYQPDKSWANLANENPQSPGLKMLADRERGLGASDPRRFHSIISGRQEQAGMIEFTDEERALLSEMRALTTDDEGREVLRGLTREETEFYVTYTRSHASGNRDRKPVTRARFQELYQKHERVRLQAIMDENYLRRENPLRQ